MTIDAPTGRLGSLTLPMPPSVNGLWYNASPKRGGGRRLTPNATRWYREAGVRILMARASSGIPREAITGPVLVCLFASRPDGRKRDLDNLIKPTLDALTKGRVWEDDSQVECLHAEWVSDGAPGTILVRLEAR